ncbi:ABC transporter ATP-binding protein [Candidatus Acetothermia bacterium]|nr:ABC transporter ATP-binding protein [Candidatus Acetothermia bacterium]
MKISVNDLHFAYPNGVEVLRELSFEISSGERVAIIGQNGAGKSTLVKHFNGLLKPSRGFVTIGDWDTQSHTVAQMAQRVGFLFQNPDEQIFKRRVFDEVAFGPSNLGLSPEEIERHVSAALSRVGLSDMREMHPYDLLPARRKLVALASVLAMETPILVLDEPTIGQDGRGLARLGALIDDLTQQGKTIITISHDMDFCAEHFERIMVMKQGRMLIDGATHDVFARFELLAEAFLEPPQMTRLGRALGLPETVTTVNEFLGAYAKTREPRH